MAELFIYISLTLQAHSEDSSTRTAPRPSRPQCLTCSRRSPYIPSAVRAAKIYHLIDMHLICNNLCEPENMLKYSASQFQISPFTINISLFRSRPRKTLRFFSFIIILIARSTKIGKYFYFAASKRNIFPYISLRSTK